MSKTDEKSHLSEMAKRIFTDLYSFSDETIDDTFKRASKEFGDEDDRKIAYELMTKNMWRPNTPVFFNAGGEKKLFSACWVTDLQDSMDSIYDIANVARKIFQAGSGIGIPIGKLREKEADIYEGKDEGVPQGKSSGPISFMSLYDAVGATTKSGGRARRAAIMCAMPVNHPDIIDFIECKSVDGTLTNMNISVSITDDFMRAFKDNIPYKLTSPSNGVVREVNARVIWDKIVDMAHKTGDPGVLFIDTINKFNPLKKFLKIECTNPCITGDTLVYTTFGHTSIKTLEAEMFHYRNVDVKYYVRSYDIDTDMIEMDEIEWCGITKKDAEIIELEIEENDVVYKIKCTPDHQIYTKNRGYVEAKNLTGNDDIFINRS
jgi:ribonucleoside-diphosphate reductase alpha chain